MIHLLTPTGDRPQSLALLFEYMTAQTYTGPVTWIIVDDGEKPSRLSRLPGNFSVDYVRRKPGSNTQAANMAAGLKLVPDEALLLIVEDDDAYLPAHVATMAEALRSFELVGERTSCYYNVATRRHRSLRGSQHASMASVGVRAAALTQLRAVCAAKTTALDVSLWKGFKGSKKLLDTQNVIGIKGMPGRTGIGVGHKRAFGSLDADNRLITWLGAELAANYEGFAV